MPTDVLEIDTLIYFKLFNCNSHHYCQIRIVNCKIDLVSGQPLSPYTMHNRLYLISKYSSDMQL